MSAAREWPEDHLTVMRHIAFAIRTTVDYDADFMTDRVLSEVIDPQGKTAAYALVRDFVGVREPEVLLELHRSHLERQVVDTHLGLGYERELRVLSAKLHVLENYINRTRWWQIRRRWTAWKEA